MLNKNIYSMELHEIIESDDHNFLITRVPGGWIYADKHNPGNIFVPYDNEFAPPYSGPKIPAKPNPEAEGRR